MGLEMGPLKWSIEGSIGNKRGWWLKTDELFLVSERAFTGAEFHTKNWKELGHMRARSSIAF
jgi:hypothetical protein